MELEDLLPSSQEAATCLCPQPDQSSPHLCINMSLRSILILSSQHCLRLPCGLFHLDFPTKTRYVLLAPSMHATWFAHLMLLVVITQSVFGEEWIAWNCLLCDFNPIQFRGLVWYTGNMFILYCEFLASYPIPWTRRLPLVGCRRLLIQYIRTGIKRINRVKGRINKKKL
jgi:hypothetical protein